MPVECYQKEVLLERLTDGVRRSNGAVTFLVGSGLSAPYQSDSPGVPLSSGIIDLIKQEFEPTQKEQLDAELAAAENKYQAAFRFLQGRRGPEIASAIIKKAVWQARKSSSNSFDSRYIPSVTTTDEVCHTLDMDLDGWFLSPGHRALGQLIAAQPVLFGGSILTTNFDPLIEVAIGAAGGKSLRTVLHRDGDLSQTQGAGCHVVHLHGYWHGADTLHSPRQLTQSRPRLKASLSHLISGRTLIIMGYSGWDDIFTRALMDVVLDDRASPDIIWTSRSSQPTLPDDLLRQLTPAMDRGRLAFYSDVDCNYFLPELARGWGADISHAGRPDDASLYAAVPLLNSALQILTTVSAEPRQRLNFSRDKQDHPPRIDIYVGRSEESGELNNSPAKIVYVTGIGGAGKSALAARFFSRPETREQFDYHVWRDCKEESERFERQLVSIVSVLSNAQISEHELSTQPIESISEIFISLVADTKILIIFDNVDHYVDLERGCLIGSVGRFCDKFLDAKTSCKIVFTCRPEIKHEHRQVSSMRLGGIKLEDAMELFRLRGAYAEESAIKRAHELTHGHAYWLDLLAAQLARQAPRMELSDLLRSFQTDTPELPVGTLMSIWTTLKEREQLVLHALAETVRPTPVLELANYLAPRLRYNQLHKAVASLKGLSLLVIKPQDDGQEVLELHPLVRAFVRTNFAKPERDWFIHAILNVYKAFFGLHRPNLSKRLSSATLDHWTEGAELHISAGEYADAVDCLHEIHIAVEMSGSPSEFIRVARLLIDAAGWDTLSKLTNLDSVVSTYIELQALAGRVDESTEALDGYFSTIDGKEPRYINYCRLRCYLHWVNGDHFTAMKWGGEAVDLRENSGADTLYDAGHDLALARRDSGMIDPALTYFLKGRALEEVLGEKTSSTSSDGPFYGNVGRCLHLMGQIEPALFCYKMSAALLESNASSKFTNKAFIRQWVAEVLLTKGDHKLGLAFMEAAKNMWRMISPPRAKKAERLMSDVAANGPAQADAIMAITAINAEELWRRWLKAK
ncbi:MAG: hypothetical protein JWM36_3343 [Hyphomicrobiales bacterium]|nr:hypothetical protein [Hyphomicrobiales bacterium]